MAENRLIALITDFGNNDHFVGTMKGVIYSINPEARFVDITHEIPRHDVLDASLKLFQCYRYFPSQTVFLCVVDPGVGTPRHILTCSDGKYLYIAPDNGVLSFIFAENPDINVYKVTYSHYFLDKVSNTFHGRDVFAPLAAHISKGLYPEETGQLIKDYHKIVIPRAAKEKQDLITGHILGFDRFGNAITNIPNTMLEAKFALKVNHHIISQACDTYDEGAEAKLNMVKGSSGFLELFVKQGNARKSFGLRRGTKLGVKLY